MSRRVRIGRAMAGASSLVGLAAILILALKDRWDLLIDSFALHNGLFAVGLGALAWLTLASEPRNGAVWTLAWASYFEGLFVASAAIFVLVAPDSIADLSISELGALSPSELPLGTAIAIYPFMWGWIPGVFLFLSVGLLLFPDGQLPSPRWRWPKRMSLSAIAVATLGAAWLSRPASGVPLDQSDVGYEDSLGGIVTWGILVSLVGTLAGAASLIVRYRRSSGVERTQIKWIAFGGTFVVVTLALGLVLEQGAESGASVSSAFMAGGLVLLTAALTIAITKYRLYDIDVVISKTVTYVSLAVVIGGIYGGAVLGFVEVFGDANQRAGGDLGIALPLGAAVLVVIVFEPIRWRLQRWANRLVYGKRAAPHEVLSQLTTQLAESSAGEGLAGLARLLQEGTGADNAVVWLRVGERLRAEAVSPLDAQPNPSEVASPDDLGGSDLELSVPVRHGGELLGALGITKPRAHPVTPADETLLADVAAGAGLLLRNLRLHAELGERADQLQASRRRLIAAHDAARLRLERDLHDGAQQQVVALKVKLGLAKTIAEREGARDLAARVADLADGTQEAVDAMRMVARGIYPPLLEAEGLGAALAAADRTVDLPLQIDLGTLPRYSKQVEETVYFCVLAAVTRAKMAGATSAQLDVWGDDASLSVTVTYDSVDRGDLTALSDRVDAFGGTVTTATSADGTTLMLTLPVAGEVMEPA